MKKLILSLSLITLMLLTTVPVYAAGTCVETIADFTTIRELKFVCTADASDASYPSTIVSSTSIAMIKGWYLLMGSAYNGATAPTALYDIALTDSTGVDILGTGGANRAGTAGVSSQFTPITDTVYATTGLRPVTTNLTMAITNNAVNSAVTTITFFFVK
jgi:hypothetical protein